jgi:hypothetical protein
VSSVCTSSTAWAVFVIGGTFLNADDHGVIYHPLEHFDVHFVNFLSFKGGTGEEVELSDQPQLYFDGLIPLFPTPVPVFFFF